MRKFTNKGILATTFVAVFGIFALATPAFAQELGFVASVISGIAQIFIELVGKLLVVLIEILLAIVKYNDFINAPAVEHGWILVRDFSNMIFLIIFIAIAFATILGVERYEWKRLLPKLLLMAVAINFSKTISGIIIDAAQVVMITFVNGFKDVAAGNLIRGFGLTDILSIRDLGAGEEITDTAVAAASILAMVLLSIAVVTLGIIVIMFLVRVIMLWILVVLSPLAFMLAATPGAESTFMSWWRQFVKYAFVGPILAFFLWLSFSIMAQVDPGGNLAEDSNINFSGGAETGFLQPAGNTAAAISGISESHQLLSFAIAIALLLLSLSFANKLGIAGSQLAGSAFSKIKSGGVKLGKLAALGVATGGAGSALAIAAGKRPSVFFGKKILGGAKTKLLEKSTQAPQGSWRRALKYLTPEPWKGFSERSELKKRWAERRATGQGREMSDVFWTSLPKKNEHGRLVWKKGKKQIPWDSVENAKILNDLAKELAPLSKEQFMSTAVNTFQHVSGTQGDRMREAILYAASSKGYNDDLISHPYFKERYAKFGKEKFGYKYGTFSSAELSHDFFYDFLMRSAKPGGGAAMVDKNPDSPRAQQAMQVLDLLEDLGRATNHPEYMGHSNFDTDAEAYRRNKFSARADAEGDAIDFDGKKIKATNIDGNTVTVKGGTVKWNHDTRTWNAQDKDKKEVQLDRATLEKLRFINKGMTDFSIGEVQKMGARDKAKVAPHPYITLRMNPATGETEIGGDISEYGLDMMEATGGEVTREAQHMPARNKQWMLSKSVSDTGSVQVTSQPKKESIEAHYRQNPALMRRQFSMLSNDLDMDDGLVIEFHNQDGDVIGDSVKGDRGRMRNWQKNRVFENIKNLRLDVLENRDEAKDKVRDLMYQYLKINQGGAVDINDTMSIRQDLTDLATAFQTILDDDADKIIDIKTARVKTDSDGKEIPAARTAFDAKKATAGVMNLLNQVVGDPSELANMEKRFNGVGSNRQPAAGELT